MNTTVKFHITGQWRIIDIVNIAVKVHVTIQTVMIERFVTVHITVSVMQLMTCRSLSLHSCVLSPKYTLL